MAKQRTTRLSKAEERKAQQVAAAAAAAEAIDNELDSELEEDDTILPSFGEERPDPNENYAMNDVFDEGFKKARSLNTAPRYHITKNSQFLAVEGYPFSWEKLQKKYGPGYYQVIAKSMSTGQIMKKQTEMVGDPNEGRESEEVETEETGTPAATESNLAILGFLQQSQERQEARAREAARMGESNMAAMLQAITAGQQKSSEMMMQMMMESNKQSQNLFLALITKSSEPKGPDPMLALVTTLLTQKPKEEAFSPQKMIEMLDRAKSDAKKEAREDMRMIEDRARKLAEDMSPAESDGDESLTKTLVKSVAPVFAEMMKQNQANEAQRAIMQERAQIRDRAALNAGFVEGQDPALRPAIGAAGTNRPAPRQAPRPPAVTDVAGAPVAGTEAAAAQPGPTEGGGGVIELNAQGEPKEIVVDARLQQSLFDFCAPDVGQAMMNRLPASKTAKECLHKLEKEGCPRQTVAAAFKLDDFYAYAEKFGLPEEAKPWLKEFHDAIQSEAKQSGANTARPSNTAATTTGNGKHTNGAANGKQPVADKRNPSARKGPGVQPRQRPKNIES